MNRTCSYSVTKWGEWSSWSDCNKSCGTGKRSRSRNCNNGSAGDQGCEGDKRETQNCNTQDCPSGNSNNALVRDS